MSTVTSRVRREKYLHGWREPVSSRPAATILLLRDTPRGPEVLMTRRSPSASFAPGAYVFPGGVVDPMDSSPAARAVSIWRPDQPEDLLAYAAAAVRESFEELGILLAPWLILVLAGGVAMVLFGNRPWADLANGLTTGAVLVLLVVLSPLLLQAIWDTSSLPAGPLRERLEAFCRAQRFRCRDILVWHTHRHMANAGVVGPTPLIRYVMLTDALLHHSPDAEVEAVFAHEVAHVRCRHLPFYVAFGLAFIVFLANLLDALAALGWVAPIEGSLGAVMATEHGVAMLAFGAFYWVVVFGYVSRRMELQADVYAVSAVEAPSAFLSALARLRALSRSPGGTSLWRHFSLDQRIALLERLRDDPAATAAFQRSVARLKRVFLLLAAAAIIYFALPEASNPGYWMVLGIFPRETWTRLLTEAGFGRMMMAAQSGRDVFQAIAA